MVRVSNFPPYEGFKGRLEVRNVYFGVPNLSDGVLKWSEPVIHLSRGVANVFGRVMQPIFWGCERQILGLEPQGWCSQCIEMCSEPRRSIAERGKRLSERGFWDLKICRIKIKTS
ncbi:hypothetical protein A9P82_13615 [Arachidicoccus ginsenosidimutans]|nr:hypothetical protein A9P82_13615 [Arachidicoccus sp. BS20]